MQGVELTPEREKELKQYQAKVRQAQAGVVGCVVTLAAILVLLAFHEPIFAILNALADAAARTFPN